MPSITQPNKTGDVKLSWNPANPEEVKHAKAHYDKLKSSAHIFFRISPDGGKADKLETFDENIGELLCEFDPNADVLATQLPGGG
jgi:hypothetical protein